MSLIGISSSSVIPETTESGDQSALYEMRRSRPPRSIQCCRSTLSPDLYPSDGAGVNYLVTRNLVTVVVAHEQGLLDDQGLLSRREIKLRESQDFDQCLPGYTACQQMYRHKWKAVYTTSERKFTEHLMQDETRFARRPRTVCSCHKRHTERVD
ncbi:hypothetical protein B0H14DRAFT_2640348 [Mycena olivaceomarginata]|nr:hypothetical protein B0H14DRAFT_2640348 [Mycena olivaceomarginata]